MKSGTETGRGHVGYTQLYNAVVPKGPACPAHRKKKESVSIVDTLEMDDSY
jgi:hypothetical protein